MRLYVLLYPDGDSYPAQEIIGYAIGKYQHLRFKHYDSIKEFVDADKDDVGDYQQPNPFVAEIDLMELD